MGSKIGKTEKQILNIIQIVSTILIIIMSIGLIIMLLLKLTDHSPTEITLLSTGFSILAGVLLMLATILFNMKEDIGGLKEFRKHTIQKINEISENVKEIKEKI